MIRRGAIQSSVHPSGFTEEIERVSPGLEKRANFREFVSDPHLKFHISPIENVFSIMKNGVVSAEFARRAGIEIDRTMGNEPGTYARYTEPRSISIVDREKNPGDKEYDDWWIREFTGNPHYVGFLLPSDMKVRPVTPEPNESLAPIRIKPNKIEGIIVNSNAELTVPLVSSTSFYKPGFTLLTSFFGDEGLKEIDENEEVIELRKQIQDLKDRFPGVVDYWPDDSREEFKSLWKREDALSEALAERILADMIGKPFEEVCLQDVLIHFAQVHDLPLYGVDSSFESQTVIWPS